MAASDVLLPEPVARRKMVNPRLVIADILQHMRQGPGCRSSDDLRDGAHHQADMALLHEGVTRSARCRSANIAKLHSLLRSNSAGLLVVHHCACQRHRVLPRQRLRRDLGDLPSTLIAGGKSAVRNRSEPLRLTIRRSRSLTNLEAWSRSMLDP